MIGATYSELRIMLEQAEKDLDERLRAARRPPEIRLRRNKHDAPQSDHQGYALDTSTQRRTDRLLVVVAVGANYTQGDQAVPTDNGTGRVEDDLRMCRRNLDRMFEHYRAHPDLWYLSEAAASADDVPPAPDQYHFIMTNYCPWITRSAWGEYSRHQREPLLERGVDMHALARQLAPFHPFWVVHGMASGMFERSQADRSAGVMKPWWLGPNLADQRNHTPKFFDTSTLLKKGREARSRQ